MLLTVEELRTFLTARAIEYLDGRTDIRTDVSLAQYGLDSMSALMICGDIEDRLNIVLDPLVALDYPSIDAMVDYLRGVLTGIRPVTALEAVATYLPPVRVPIGSLRTELGLSTPELKVFQRYFGLAEVRRDPGGTLTDLLLGAAGRLPDLPRQAHRIRYVVQARSHPVVVPYPVNPLHEVCERIGLRHCVAFAVTQHACASGLLAIDIAGRLLAADGDPDALALVLTGEKTFTRGARIIPRTAIMGEGSAACLVSADGPRDRVIAYATAMYPQYDNLPRTGDLASEFGHRYPHLLADAMAAALDRAGLTLAEVALILPHNVNTISWDRLCQALGFPLERVLLDNVPLTGHCFCADGFINYRTASDQGRLRPGDHYLMTAVGVGATFSAMVFRH